MDIEDFKIEKRAIGYTISEYTGYDSTVKIPAEINDKEIKNIGDYAFAACINLETIELPNTITEILPNAFYRCDSLKEIIFKGTKNEWNKIKIATDLDDIRIIFSPESELSNFVKDVSENSEKELKDE